MDRKLRIGITERGDAGLDLSWTHRLSAMDGAILITKNLNDHFRQALRDAAQTKPVILHAGCTGWGGSALEPRVPRYDETLARLNAIVGDGTLPLSRCVLRIDPIVPTPEGLGAVRKVLDGMLACENLQGIRVRISVLDEYRHVKKRLRSRGWASFYPGDAFQASPEQFAAVQALLDEYHDRHGVVFETCAEPALTGDAVLRTGCVSAVDLTEMGLPVPDAGTNPQGRGGCLCLSCKTELLTCKAQCPHGCLYCYWKS